MSRGLLQGNNLRENRQEYDMGYGDKRLAMGRAGHVSMGNFVDYYADLGLAVTPDQASELRERDASFLKLTAEQQSKINEAQGKVSEYKKTIDSISVPDTTTLINEEWDKFEGGFIPVQVMDYQNWKQKAQYMLPKDVVKEIASIYGTSNDGDKEVKQEYTSGGTGTVKSGTDGYQVNYNNNSDPDQQTHTYPTVTKWVNGALQISSNAYYGMIDDVLDETSDKVYTTFIEHAAELIPPEIRKMSDIKDTALKGYNEAQSQISAAQSAIDRAKESRERQWADARGEYKRRQETLKEIYGNLKVGEPDA